MTRVNLNRDSPQSSTADAGPAPLRAAVLRQCVQQAAPDRHIEVDAAARLASTNAQLLEQARHSQPESVRLLAADHQSAGRGRQGRAWHARPGSALLFSVAVPLARVPPELPAVTLACGVIIADALRARGVVVQLKWPNDLLLEGRKLGGILCELATDAAGRATLIAGVGINGWLAADDRAAIGQPAAALADAADLASGREPWIAALAVALLEAVTGYAARGFDPWRARFNALLHGRGQLADIVESGRSVATGRIVEVDAAGRLVLDASGSALAISVGDVSLRVAPGGATR